MPGRMEFDLPLQPQPRATVRAGGGPARLLLIGDFAGAAERPPLADRRPQRIDADNFDAVLRQFAPRCAGPAQAPPFEGLDDFHPDRLFERRPEFAALRALRRRLLDPAQFAAAAAEMKGSAAAPVAASPASPSTTASSAAPAATGADLLAGLLGGRPAAASPPVAPARGAAGIDAFVRGIVGAAAVPDTTALQAQLVASADGAIAVEMRALLHEPSFQALEAAWRGAHWLVAGLELGATLQLHLLDARRDELLADVVAAQGQWRQTALHRVLARDGPGVAGGPHWSLLAGLYGFGPSDADIGLLAALGLIAAGAAAPFVAAGESSLARGDAPALAGWQALRRSQAAPWLVLAAPRLLLRRPYGRGSDPVAGFDFEEFTGTPRHADWLWGPGSLAIALLAGRGDADADAVIDDLPACVVERDGERELQACAEFYLSDEEARELHAAGLTPLVSHRQRNAVRVLPRRSIADRPVA